MFRLCLGSIALAGLALLLLGPIIGQADEPLDSSPPPTFEPAEPEFGAESDTKQSAAFDQAAGPVAPSGDVAADVIAAQDALIRLDQEAVLASDRPGILKFVAVKEGDRVDAGSQVAGLRDEVAIAALRVARRTAENDVEIRYAQAAAAVSEAEYERSLEANERGRKIQLSADLIVAVELERLRLAVERSQLQVLNAQLEQEIARLSAEEKAAELETYQIVTPIDGVVTEVLKHAGEAVQQGDPILRVVRTDVVKIEAFVSVADAFRVQPGDPVRVQLNAREIPNLPEELAERRFEGEIVFVNPTAVPVSNVVSVLATVRNDDNLLRGGLPATMEIRTQNRAGQSRADQAGDSETQPTDGREARS